MLFDTSSYELDTFGKIRFGHCAALCFHTVGDCLSQTHSHMGRNYT